MILLFWVKDRPDLWCLLLQVGNKGGSLSGYDAPTSAKVGGVLILYFLFTLAVLTLVTRVPMQMARVQDNLDLVAVLAKH